MRPDPHDPNLTAIHSPLLDLIPSSRFGSDGPGLSSSQRGPTVAPPTQAVVSSPARANLAPWLQSRALVTYMRCPNPPERAGPTITGLRTTPTHTHGEQQEHKSGDESPLPNDSIL